MAKSSVLTNRKRLDAFLAQAGRLDDLSVLVGIVTGKARYPKGHVGRKSRMTRYHRTRPKTITRRAVVSKIRRHLETMKGKDKRAATKMVRQEFRRRGISTRGLATTRRGTAVARVAGVMAARDDHHRAGIVASEAPREGALAGLWLDVLNGRSPSRGLQQFGRISRDSVRKKLRQTGHIDTGKMLRNTQYQIETVSGKAKAKRLGKARRALARRQRKVRAFARRQQVKRRRGRRGLARAARVARRRR